LFDKRNIVAKQLQVFYYTLYSLTLIRICLVMRNQNTHKTWNIQLIKLSNI